MTTSLILIHFLGIRWCIFLNPINLTQDKSLDATKTKPSIINQCISLISPDISWKIQTSDIRPLMITVPIWGDFTSHCNVARIFHLLRWGRGNDGDRQNIKNILHRNGSCCGGAIGLFDHNSGIGGDDKGHWRHPWQLGLLGCPLLTINHHNGKVDCHEL